MSTMAAKKSGGALSAHLKKQNIFFYLSALSSVAIIALMFVPWLSEPKAASLLTLLMDCSRSTEVLIFMIPIMLGVIIVHGLYLFSLFRPDQDPMYAGTVSVLLAGLMIFMLLFSSDVAYNLISGAEYTSNFIKFLGADKWTWIPVIWFVITLLQKLLFTRLAHKKEVISYT